MNWTLFSFGRAAAIAGMIGPTVLGGAIGVLTILQRDFLRGLGWHPLRAPTIDWPSGLALGPYGDVMVGTFIVSGLSLAFFAAGLYRGIAPSATARNGAALLALAGIATMLLGFKGDPTYAGTPRTLVGTVHDLAFALLGVSLLTALVVLARCFRNDPRWHNHARYTMLTALLVAPAFWFKGLVFYLFLANILLWFELTAWQLWRVAQQHDMHP
jgi:hypothetical protein